jgi:hypothetical protein
MVFCHKIVSRLVFETLTSVVIFFCNFLHYNKMRTNCTLPLLIRTGIASEAFALWLATRYTHKVAIHCSVVGPVNFPMWQFLNYFFYAPYIVKSDENRGIYN